MQKSPVSSRYQSLCKPTIWQQVVSLVVQTKGVNLSQGAPEMGPQPFFLSNMEKASKQAIEQECDTKGIQHLRKTISRFHERQYGQIDYNKNIAITAGASIALYLLFATFVDPKDQVVLFEPTFDFYRHFVTIFKGKSQNVKLISNDKKSRTQVKEMVQNDCIDAKNWQIDWQALQSKLNAKTKIILINSPQNPTGKIFTQDQIDRICVKALELPNLVIIQDCVYEGFMFDQFKGKVLPKVVHSKHYPQLKQRVINVYSAGKLLEATGIRCGWIIGPENIVNLFHKFSQQSIKSVSYMIQKAVAYCLQDIVNQQYHYIDLQAHRLQNHRKQLLKVLSESKYDFKIMIPKSGYFILVDIQNIQIEDKYFKMKTQQGQTPNPRDLAFCYQMAFQDGVIIVPCSTFFSSQNKQQNFIRFAHCKSIDVIRSAKQKLKP